MQQFNHLSGYKKIPFFYVSINKINAKEIEMYSKAVKEVLVWFITLPV